MNSAAIPNFVKYKGSLDTAVHYTDKEGEHILITSEDFKLDSAEMVITSADNKDSSVSKTETKSANLYAYNYIISGKTAKLLWQMHDFVDSCDFDITAGYLPGTFAITDLDKNGIAEVWLMYKVDCASDVSPVPMKIIMHEGAQKYAMRGGTRVKVNATEYTGGKYIFDEAFSKAPEVFKQHARLLWSKNLMEHFQEQ